MADAFKCDVCGKFVDDLEKKTKVSIRRKVNGVMKDLYERKDKYDVCEDCAKEMSKFLFELKSKKRKERRDING